MSNVVVDREKIDLLANAISAKSGEPLTLTLDEMVEAVDGIEAYSAPTLQSKTYTVDSAGTETITADSGYDGLSEVEVSVPSAASVDYGGDQEFFTQSGNRKWHERIWVDYDGGGFISGVQYSGWQIYSAIASGTSVTPTETAQTIGGRHYMMEGAVTVNPIPSQYIVPSGTINITSSGNTNVTNYATASVASGSATASATKGTVSNHQVSVTPSVTRTAGYITAGSANGTAVTVSASELVSGSQTITQNGTVDVTNLASVTVNVSGGGGSDVAVVQTDTILSSASTSITFTGLNGEPTSFDIIYGDTLATGASPWKTAMVVYDGTNIIGQTITNTSNAQVSYDDTGFSKSYSNGTLTVTGTGTEFQAGQYWLNYTYGGTAGNIHTADVQVGSGATSITFTGLDDEPIYWSCIFKSNFSTSNGYQRVIGVDMVGFWDEIFGLAMDSSAHPSDEYWSASYSNGSLTITSNGTNQGGYFHQPGYYQLTYAISGEAPEITTEPLSVTENGTYTAPRGKAYTPVTVNVSSGGGASIDTKTVTNDSNTATTLSFTSMSGRPSAFFVRCQTQIQSSGSTNYYYVDNMRYNGTDTKGTYVRIGGTRGIYPDTTHYSYSYTGTTLTLTTTGSRTGAGGSFYNGTYELVYVY